MNPIFNCSGLICSFISLELETSKSGTFKPPHASSGRQTFKHQNHPPQATGGRLETSKHQNHPPQATGGKPETFKSLALLNFSVSLFSS